ncbi:hypothetical protein AVU38_gp126 [Ralstonia phage RSL2]|uniref:hypothetical protein n=1 Tax=Ralstonia phage RSL2 TaxID=1585840 RepID=UPI00054A7DD3|nr:hypothetical protein AVU38_gp126 [Ralstonia phage RSL2]
MPYTPSQRKLFQAAAHNEDIAKRHHMTQEQARKLMEEDKKIEAHISKSRAAKKRS